MMTLTAEELRRIASETAPDDSPQLWAHQAEAGAELLAKAAIHGGAVLDMGMGTGKTRVLLTLIAASISESDRAEPGRYLIVAPNSAIGVWATETAKYFHLDIGWGFLRRSNTQPISKYAAKIQPELQTGKDHLLTAVTYQALLNGKFLDMLQDICWDIIIYDESHKLANSRPAGSKTAAIAASRKWQAKQRYAISGTTHPRSLLELHGQIRFAAPRAFPSNWNTFIGRYATIKKSSHHIPGSVIIKGEATWPYAKIVASPTEEYQHLVLHHPNSPVYVAPPAEQLIDLPPVSHIPIPCEMSPAAKKIYRQLDTTGRAVLPDGAEVNTTPNGTQHSWTAQALLQVTSGSLGSWEDDQPAKKEALADLLSGLPPEDKVVVFCWWERNHRQAAAVADKLGGSATITGSTPPPEREKIVARWSTPAGPRVLTYSPAIAEGVDLTAACRAVFWSLPWQPQALSQSIARLNRAGQTRKVAVAYLMSVCGGNPTIDNTQHNLLTAHLDRASLQNREASLPSETIGKNKQLLLTGASLDD